MNFGQFASKLKASAANAADAARAFQGFDAMAANDEYIHSENLNVRRDRKKGVPVQQTAILDESISSRRSTSQSQSQEQPRWSQNDTNTANESMLDTSYSSRISREYLLSSSHHSLNAEPISVERQPEQQSPVPLLSVVQRTLSSQHSRLPHPSDEEGEDESSFSRSMQLLDDSDEEEFEDDPILSMIRDTQSIGNSSKRLDPLEVESAPSVRKKNTQRFMEDLENRMSIPQASYQGSEEALPLTISPPSEEESSSSSRPMGWFWSLRSQADRKQTGSNAAVAPWSRSRTQKQDKHQEEESFEVITSKTMLGEDEMKEFAQMREQAASKVDSITLAWFVVKEHPRETFIVFTLLLGAFVYFYSRRNVVDDDIT